MKLWNPPRRTSMYNMQTKSDEIVYWIDCGFYLMPVTLSTLLHFSLTLEKVNVVNPLDYAFTKNNPVFESTEIPHLRRRREEEETKKMMYDAIFFSIFM